MSNVERSHRRYVSTISYWAREVPGLRHLDLDLYQYCADCGQPEAFFEVKGSNVGDAHWRQARRLAAHQNGVAALVIEDFDLRVTCTKEQGCPCQCHTHPHHDPDEGLPIKVMDPNGKIRSVHNYTKPEFHRMLLRCHDYHVTTHGHDRYWWRR